MTTLEHKDTYVFHIATTGLDVETARIVGASISGPQESFEYLIKTDTDIPAEASAVHGITKETYKNKKSLSPKNAISDIIDRLKNIIANGHAILGFNITFDLTILEYEAKRHGITPFSEYYLEKESHHSIIDALIIFTALNPYHKGGKTLDNLNEHYELEQDDLTGYWEKFTERTQNLFHMVIVPGAEESKNVNFLDTPINKINNWCAEWRQKQNQSYVDYLRTRGHNRIDHVTTVQSGYPIYDTALGKENYNYNTSF